MIQKLLEALSELIDDLLPPPQPRPIPIRIRHDPREGMRR
jgi:hypothetical protein